jgi:trans-2,3-dihydro-3-hydroxyanthranilate isomerase
MAARSYAVADVFTEMPLAGNPVAVFEDGSGLSTEVMQRTARELNLSETVFLLPGDGEIDARARIFTPTVEMPFAGHPVLGSAFVIGERLGTDTVRLQTGAGLVPVMLQRDEGAVVFGEMEQPIPTWEPFERAAELLAALGVDRPELPVEVYDNGPRHVMVALADEATVASLSPDMGALLELGAVGLSTFALAGDHVRTRMFGPGLGVPEDPATGSAAGPLGVHLARHGRVPWGRPVEIHQGAEVGRPSVLHVRVEGSDAAVQRVTVGGAAVVVARGEYRLD